MDEDGEGGTNVAVGYHEACSDREGGFLFSLMGSRREDHIIRSKSFFLDLEGPLAFLFREEGSMEGGGALGSCVWLQRETLWWP